MRVVPLTLTPKNSLREFVIPLGIFNSPTLESLSIILRMQCSLHETERRLKGFSQLGLLSGHLGSMCNWTLQREGSHYQWLGWLTLITKKIGQENYVWKPRSSLEYLLLLPYPKVKDSRELKQLPPHQPKEACPLRIQTLQRWSLGHATD